MLWRGLGNVASGFYIDIGAAWPDRDSVTRAFYERGWRGINVEPDPDLYRLLSATRVRDTNLACAISEFAGPAQLLTISGSGLSTLSHGVAKDAAAAGYSPVATSVDCMRLDELWSEHVPDNQDVHFIKIDVEGAETGVIRSNDWARNRPWVAVVESTRPRSPEESFSGWEPVLLQAGYVHIYEDGLNRFYAAAEKEPELRAAFRHPPNVFDRFERAEVFELKQRVIRLRHELEAARSPRGIWHSVVDWLRR